MNFTQIKKDVTTLNLNCRCAVAHCVSCDCALGAGVALALANRYPTMRSECIAYASSPQQAVPGNIYRFSIIKKTGTIGADEPNSNVHTNTVYNMFTKKRFFDNSRRGMSTIQYLDYLQTCLLKVRQSMEENNETTLYIPQISCGLDRCNWSDVYNIINSVFKDSNINIVLCSLADRIVN